MTLAWNAITNGNVAGYRIYQGGASHVYTSSISAGTALQRAITNLTTGATYYFSVAAYNSAGNESDFSSEVSYTPSAVVVTNPPPVGQPPTPGGLVAAYSFDEGSGATAFDSSGSGNNGTIKGASWVTYGRFGRGLAFDGSTSVVTVSDSSSLDLTSGMTLEAWVYPSSFSIWNDMIYKGGDAYYLEAASSLTAGASVGTGTKTLSSLLSSPKPLPLGAWTHVAATYDGATLRIFTNGVLAASRPQTGSLSVSALPLSIGGDPSRGTHYCGVMDEVRIYSRALAASEIQADMNTSVGSPGLQLPWESSDIGTVSVAGAGTGSNNTLTVTGNGALKSTSDNFHFVYQPMSGDGEIRAQISAVSSRNYMAGAMIRESLAPNAIYTLIGAANGKMFREYRASTGGAASATSWSNAQIPKAWVRIVRSGNVLTRYQSSDGVNWSTVDTRTISMASQIYVGLAVNSNGGSSTARATFSNVNVTP